MKNFSRIFLPLSIICTLLALTTCAPDVYDNAMLNISVNGNGARSASLAVLDVSIEEITHQITLTGPTGVLTYSVTGGGNISASVAAGTWRVDVTGFYGEEIYSTGTASVTVKAGQSSSVSVLMTVVWQEGDLIPPGIELPQLPGIAWIDGYHWFQPGASVPNTIEVYYDDPTWTNYDPAIPTSPFNGYIVQWYLGGQLVQTDTDVVFFSPTSSSMILPITFEVKEEYWNRDVFAIVSHGDYYGVRSNSLRICKAIDNPTDFQDFLDNAFGWEWEGNSYILTSGSYSQSNSPPQIPFNGYLDGNDNAVNVNVTLATVGSAGLFAHIGPRGTVINLEINGFVDSMSSDDCYIGGVAGLNEGTIMNIRFDDSGGSDFKGDSSFPATSKIYVGGIAGRNKGIIKNCYVYRDSSGDIWANSSLESYAGGIAGVNEGEISFCWVMVDTDIYADDGAGGIAGKNDKIINHCVVLEGIIKQYYGLNGAGRIWGTGNGTGWANYANYDNDPGGMLDMIENAAFSTASITVDYTDDVTTSKHGKGVQYDPGGPVFSNNDAALEEWWIYTAGWGDFWSDIYSDRREVEKPWTWDPSSAIFWPLLRF